MTVQRWYVVICNECSDTLVNDAGVLNQVIDPKQMRDIAANRGWTTVETNPTIDLCPRCTLLQQNAENNGYQRDKERDAWMLYAYRTGKAVAMRMAGCKDAEEVARKRAEFLAQPVVYRAEVSERLTELLLNGGGSKYIK